MSTQTDEVVDEVYPTTWEGWMVRSWGGTEEKWKRARKAIGWVDMVPCENSGCGAIVGKTCPTASGYHHIRYVAWETHMAGFVKGLSMGRRDALAEAKRAIEEMS